MFQHRAMRSRMFDGQSWNGPVYRGSNAEQSWSKVEVNGAGSSYWAAATSAADVKINDISESRSFSRGFFTTYGGRRNMLMEGGYLFGNPSEVGWLIGGPGRQ